MTEEKKKLIEINWKKLIPLGIGLLIGFAFMMIFLLGGFGTPTQ